jgi:hypothetical protein
LSLILPFKLYTNEYYFSFSEGFAFNWRQLHPINEEEEDEHNM